MKLTKDSSHLVEFIEKKTQKNIKINKNSNNYLLNLLQQLNYHYHNSKKFIDNNIVNYNLVENLNVDFFIPKPILEVINKKCVNYYTIDIKINAAITFRIHLYFINKPSQMKLTNIIEKMYTILNLLSLYSPLKGLFDISIYFTDFKKTMPKSGVLDLINVNTAYTSKLYDNIDIHIFRTEEWYKVLIHEVFHALKLDFAFSDQQNNSSAFIYDLFKIQIADPRIYEAYTESFANILNVLSISFFNTRIKSNYSLMLKKFEEYINNEINWSFIQANKVMNYNNLKYENMIHTYKHRYEYEEKTHIISYYIVKLILLFHFNDFSEWCISTNKGLKFDVSNIESFFTFIREHHDTDEFLIKMKEFGNINTTGFIKNTLRMSIYEYNF
jgi:hypothetical protein